MGIKIKKSDGQTVNMNLDDFSRWACFMEAFELISKKSEELEIDFLRKWSHNDVCDFINARYPGVRHDVEAEVKMGILS